MAQITLSLDRYTALLEAERKFNELPVEYDKLEECGVDCSSERAVLQMSLEQIAALKKNFAPTGVSKLKNSQQ